MRFCFCFGFFEIRFLELSPGPFSSPVGLLFLCSLSFPLGPFLFSLSFRSLFSFSLSLYLFLSRCFSPAVFLKSCFSHRSLSGFFTLFSGCLQSLFLSLRALCFSSLSLPLSLSPVPIFYPLSLSLFGPLFNLSPGLG